VSYSNAIVGNYYLIIGYWAAELPDDSGYSYGTITGATYLSRAHTTGMGNTIAIELIKATSTTITFNSTRGGTILGLASI